MIKKYMLIIVALLVLLIFTSTSTASFLFSEGEIYGRLPENSPLKNMLGRLSQVISNNNDIVSDEEDGDGADDEDENDDLMDKDDPLEEDVILPKIWDLVGEKTPDDGNEPVDDSEEILNTIDPPDGAGVVWNNETVDSDGDVGAVSNDITIPDYVDESEWTVDLERFVEIVTERNVKFGETLQRMVERTFAQGTTESDGTAENDVVGVVVEGESVGTPGADIADVVVLTDDGDQ